MAQEQDSRDVWEKALSDYGPAVGGAAAGYAAGRYLRNRRFRGLKIQQKVVSIRPKRSLIPSGASEPGQIGSRPVRYYVDREGRRYQPAEYNPQTGGFTPSFRSRQYMMREDGVIFKLRKDGKYIMQVPKRPAGAAIRRRRRK